MSKEKKEINRVTFEIEEWNGNTFLAFEIAIFDNGEIDVTKNYYCSLADVDGDYIFDTKNDLYRIQKD